MAKRIGITMRVDNASSHNEPRDCLAQDWANYMTKVSPNTFWMPLPNLSEAIADYVQHWQLDGFIFSGGNDLGSCQLRDSTEFTLLNHALRNALPVFGVCRGLQLLQQHANGSLRQCERDVHVANVHPIHLRTDLLEFNAPGQANVNSYHQWAVPQHTLAPALELLAASSDGCVEAVRHRAAPIVAVQWHPERKVNPLQAKLDRNFLYNTLQLEN